MKSYTKQFFFENPDHDNSNQVALNDKKALKIYGKSQKKWSGAGNLQP
jgi:hypothetical protein